MKKLKLLIMSLFVILYTNTLFANFNFDIDNNELKKLINWNYQDSRLVDTSVAVIDSGVKIKHFDNLLPGWNFIEDSNVVNDFDGHGTAVASVIATLLPEAQILPLKVARNGSSTNKDMINAIIFAIRNNIRVLNISLGINKMVLQEVKNKVGPILYNNTLFVVSAGNRGQVMTNQFGGNVIVVGATTIETPIKLTSYSNWGRNVDIAAPAGRAGKGITVYSIKPKLQYRFFNGTSAAAPVVASIAAGFIYEKPNLDAFELKKLILNKGKSEKSLQGKVQSGKVASF